MAKSKAFFGLRSGSTKSHTYQVYRGEQITKDRVTKVANPQTAAQMAQRLKLVTVANAAAALDSLVDHSFQSVEYGYKSVAEFRRLNLADDNLKISGYVPKGATDPGVSNLIVSKGSLPSFVVSQRVSNDMYFTGFKSTPLTIGPSGAALSATEDNAKQIAGFFGVEAGDQITFLLQVVSNEVEREYNGISYYPSYFIIARMVTDYEDPDFMKGWIFDKAGLFNNGIIAVNSEYSDGGIDVGFADANVSFRNWPAELGESSDDFMIAAMAVIRSHKSDNVWQRSTQRLVVNTTTEVQNLLWPYDDAVKTYLKNTASSKKYLNSGTDGVTIIGGNS